MFWLRFCSWTPAELQNGNFPLQPQKRYLLSYTANCPATRSPPRRCVCMPPKNPAHSFNSSLGGSRRRIVSQCARRGAFMRMKPFLTSACLGRCCCSCGFTSAENNKARIIVDESLLSLLCVFLRVCLCWGCMQRSHWESFAHILSACISVSPAPPH